MTKDEKAQNLRQKKKLANKESEHTRQELKAEANVANYVDITGLNPNTT